jgi:hypothetical protein
MKRRRRIDYSAVQRSEIWDPWQADKSMRSIGPGIVVVFSVISPTGGIRPPVRHRAKQVLTLSEPQSGHQTSAPPTARVRAGKVRRIVAPRIASTAH